MRKRGREREREKKNNLCFHLLGVGSRRNTDSKRTNINSRRIGPKMKVHNFKNT